MKITIASTEEEKRFKTGEAVPRYEKGGFINTLAGWNLLARLHNNGKDGAIYRTARSEFDRRIAERSKGEPLARSDVEEEARRVVETLGN